MKKIINGVEYELKPTGKKLGPDLRFIGSGHGGGVCYRQYDSYKKAVVGGIYNGWSDHKMKIIAIYKQSNSISIVYTTNLEANVLDDERYLKEPKGRMGYSDLIRYQ